MKITENFIKQDSSAKHWDWGQYNNKILKGEYESEHKSEVKTYKMSKEELQEYLKKFK